jgi:hypothetical protein
VGDPGHASSVDEADRLRTLAAVLPQLEAPTPDFGHWEIPPPREGVESLGYYVFGPVGEAFLKAVSRGGWVIMGFDWRAWLDGPEGGRLRDDPETVATATSEQLAKLLTAIIRSDRFVEGSIAGAFESGLIVRIARRAKVLLG